MANPQQPELRRSGRVAALDPDATESDLAAHERPTTKGRGGPIPEEQRPGHHPDQEQDKPDLDAFAERLGIVPEDQEPPDAPRVEDEDASVTRLADAPSKVKARAEAARSTASATAASSPPAERTWSPIGLVLVGPVTGLLVARGVLRALTRKRR